MKAVLVIDMPTRCEECPLLADEFCYGIYRARCVYDDMGKNGRAKWCPLKPLPEKMIPEMVLGNAFAEGCVQGWNNCLDEITGETE